MFCLLVHLDGFRQLERIRPNIVHDLVALVDQTLSRSGASRQLREGGVSLYLFAGSAEPDHRQMLDAAFSLRDELERYQDELTDFTIVLEYLANDQPADVMRRLRNSLGRLTEERSVWIGPKGAPVLAADAEVSQHGSFLRVESAVRTSPHKLSECADFMRNDTFAASMLEQIEPWLNAQQRPTIALISCRERVYARENVRHVLRTLYGSACDERWVTLYPSEREDESVGPIANSIAVDFLPHVAALLNSHELKLWHTVEGALRYIAESPTQFGLFDGVEADVLAAFALYLTALFRSLQRDLLPPVIVMENVDLFPLDAVRLLRRVFDRVAGEFAPLILATSVKPVVPVGLADIATLHNELPLFGADEVTDHAVRFLSEAAERHIRIADCCRRTRGLPLELYFHFVNVQHSLEHPASTRIDVKQQGQESEARAMLERLNQDEREILAIAALVGGHGAGALVAEISARLGYEQLRVRQVARRLVALGLMRDAESMFVETARVRQAVLSSCGSDRKRIEAAVGRTLLTVVDTGQARLTPSLLSIVLSSADDWIPALRDLLRHALDARRFERAAKIVTSGADLAACAGNPQLVRQILAGAELRSALLLGDQVRADRLWESRSAFHGRNAFERSVEADTTLEHARYVIARGNRTQAVALCKRAIMLYQEGGDGNGIGRANIEFGNLLLGQEKLSDARDYFVMARPPGSAAHDDYPTLRARSAELVCLFLAGELTRVAGQIDDLRSRSSALGLREADLFLQLLHGRVRFELGYYREALAQFQQALCDAVMYRLSESRRVLRAWIARCLIYLGDSDSALRALAVLPATEEVRFFRAEALERKGEPEKALAEISAATQQSAALFRSPEQIDWRSGFASIEDRAVGVSGGDSVLGHLTKTFRAYLLALTGEPDQGIAEFHYLTRKEKISAADPYNRLYYYLYSMILPYSHNPDCEDSLTVLGKSVKYMQERSSRIDQYRDKRSFLSANYWNKQLLDSARSHNLL